VRTNTPFIAKSPSTAGYEPHLTDHRGNLAIPAVVV
jgi:hypothetical protein